MQERTIPLSLLLLLLRGLLTSSFAPVKVLVSPRKSVLFSSAIDSGGGSGGGKWKLSNNFHQFLNQCSIQSFMIVASSLRDPQTTRWINNFTAPVFDESEDNIRLTGTTEATNELTSDDNVANPNGESLKLLKYHGLGVMNTTTFPTWESYFSTLLDQPAETLLVTPWNDMSKEYEVDINPASLCTRIISVRDQIAEEFANDLGVVANMGYHTMDSYWDYMENEDNKDSDSDNDSDDAPETLSISELGKAQENPINPDEGAAAVSYGNFGDTTPRILPPHDLVFLNYALDTIDGFTPSPLRRGNFDLVVLLATQESIHRILNNDQQEDLGIDRDMFQKYLLDFYAARIDSHFSGIQRYSRADDFLEELLFSSPRMSTGDGVSGLVNPVRLTEIVLDERRHVALEWQAMSKDVPNDHISIKRLQLDKLMQSYS